MKIYEINKIMANWVAYIFRVTFHLFLFDTQFLLLLSLLRVNLWKERDIYWIWGAWNFFSIFCDIFYHSVEYEKLRKYTKIFAFAHRCGTLMKISWHLKTITSTQIVFIETEKTKKWWLPKWFHRKQWNFSLLIITT